MNSQYNFRLLLIRLLLTTCFVVGTTSAPINTEVEIADSGPEVEDVKEEMLSSESKRTDVIKQDPRGLPNPFLNALPGKETSGSSGLPGVPNFGSSLDGAKLYLGAFQIIETPMPKATDIAGMLGNMSNMPGMSNVPLLGSASAPT